MGRSGIREGGGGEEWDMGGGWVGRSGIWEVGGEEGCQLTNFLYSECVHAHGGGGGGYCDDPFYIRWTCT